MEERHATRSRIAALEVQRVLVELMEGTRDEACSRRPAKLCTAHPKRQPRHLVHRHRSGGRLEAVQR
eukprot:2198596-Prymnesium_polylepis.1